MKKILLFAVISSLALAGLPAKSDPSRGGSRNPLPEVDTFEESKVRLQNRVDHYVNDLFFNIYGLSPADAANLHNRLVLSSQESSGRAVFFLRDQYESEIHLKLQMLLALHPTFSSMGNYPSDIDHLISAYQNEKRNRS